MNPSFQFEPFTLLEDSKEMKLVAILMVLMVVFTQAADPPKVGDSCRIGTNRCVVVYVGEKDYPVNCLTNGTNRVVWMHDGPTFIGVSPTNQLDKLIICPWPEKK